MPYRCRLLGHSVSETYRIENAHSSSSKRTASTELVELFAVRLNEVARFIDDDAEREDVASDAAFRRTHTALYSQ